MNTDDLIKGLVSDLAPVKKQSSPSFFAIKYLLFLLLVILAGVLLLRFRNDFRTEVGDLHFLLDTFFNIAILLSGIFLTGRFSSAGRSYNQNLNYIIFGLFIIVIGFNAYRLSIITLNFKNITMNIVDSKCFGIVMLFSFISMGIVGKAVSKRVVLRPGLTGAIIGLLSFSVGSFTAAMHCPITAEHHVTMYHTLLPMISGTTIGYFCGKSFLKI